MSAATALRRGCALCIALLFVATAASAAYEETWRLKLDKGSTHGLTVSADGGVFTTVRHNSSGSVYANRADGKRLWRTKTKESVGGVAMATDGSGVLVAAVTGSGKISLTSLDPATGDELWSQTYSPAGNFKARDNAVVAVSDKDGTIYVAATLSLSGVCCAYAILQAAPDGTENWSHRTGNAGDNSASVFAIAADPKGNGVYVSGDGTSDGAENAFLARYGADGEELWRTFRDPEAGVGPVTVSSNGKKIFVFGKKKDANYFQAGLFNQNGKDKWLRPILLTGTAALTGDIKLSNDGKSLYMSGSLLDSLGNEFGFLQRTNTKTSGPTTVLSGTEFPDASWTRFVGVMPDDGVAVIEQRINADTGVFQEPQIARYDE